MKYFLAPRSGEKSYENFKSTIKNGIPFEVISKYLNQEGVKKVGGEEVVYAWGNRESRKTRWEKMSDGDTVIFYANKRLVMAGEVYFKQHSRELALAMWPPDENGNPWEYTFFLRNLKYISIPIKVFNSIATYEPKFIVQGFEQITDTHMESILNKYDSIEAMINEFSDDNSAEMPLQDDKLYVNIDPEIQPVIIIAENISPLVRDNTESINKRARKIDYQKRSNSNALTGSLGEQIVLEAERKRLKDAGHADLSEKITRVSLKDDTCGYDILSFEENGDKRLIEVKTTAAKSKHIRFYLSANEYKIGTTSKNYYVYFVDGVKTKTPKITIVKDPFDDQKFSIIPDTYILEGSLD